MTTTATTASAYDVRRVATDHPGVVGFSVRRRDGEAFTRFSDLSSIKEAHAPDADVTSVDLWTWLRDAQHAAEAARNGADGNGAHDPDVAKSAAATNPPAVAHAAPISVPPRPRGGTLNLSRPEVAALRDHLAYWLAGAPNQEHAELLRAIKAKLDRIAEVYAAPSACQGRSGAVCSGPATSGDDRG